MANFKMGVGGNIKMFRKLKNITQEELAEIIGIHSRQLSKIETGEHFPSCKTLERIENGWKVCKSYERDIQVSNRETDPQRQLSEIKQIDKLPEQEDLL